MRELTSREAQAQGLSGARATNIFAGVVDQGNGEAVLALQLAQEGE